ncbi:MAG: hypothetical protein EOO34_00570 [Cyanobacteriota bacterium]|nr:MAG: hypothetical protein EOO34_00570 [Cyanobacteriota bacterium]
MLGLTNRRFVEGLFQGCFKFVKLSAMLEARSGFCLGIRCFCQTSLLVMGLTKALLTSPSNTTFGGVKMSVKAPKP